MGNSTSTDGIYVSRGELFFKPEGATNWRLISMIQKGDLEVTNDYAEAFDKSGQTTRLAKKVLTKENLKFTFETQDASIENLAMFLRAKVEEKDYATGDVLPSGTIATQDTTVKVLTPDSSQEIEGALMFKGVNELNEGYPILLMHKVNVQSSGALTLISDDVRSLSFECNVLVKDGKTFTQYIEPKQ